MPSTTLTLLVPCNSDKLQICWVICCSESYKIIWITSIKLKFKTTYSVQKAKICFSPHLSAKNHESVSFNMSLFWMVLKLPWFSTTSIWPCYTRKTSLFGEWAGFFFFLSMPQLYWVIWAKSLGQNHLKPEIWERRKRSFCHHLSKVTPKQQGKQQT